MLNMQKVHAAFSLFSDLPDKQAMQWHVLCENAAASLEKRLREGADTENRETMSRLCTAAGAFAYCDYLTLQTEKQPDSIRVGDISLGSSASAADAMNDIAEIRGYFLAQVSDLLQPDTFAFRQTEAS